MALHFPPSGRSLLSTFRRGLAVGTADLRRAADVPKPRPVSLEWLGTLSTNKKTIIDADLRQKIRDDPTGVFQGVVAVSFFSPEFRSLPERQLKQYGVTLHRFVNGSYLFRDATSSSIKALLAEPGVVDIHSLP